MVNGDDGLLERNNVLVIFKVHGRRTNGGPPITNGCDDAVPPPPSPMPRMNCMKWKIGELSSTPGNSRACGPNRYDGGDGGSDDDKKTMGVGPPTRSDRWMDRVVGTTSLTS